MLVRWWMLFSNWIFVAAILYAVGVHKVSTFPASLVALPFGIFFIVRKYRVDPLWKLFAAAALHIIPFLLVPWLITKENVAWTIGLLLIYTFFMTATQGGPVDIYRETYYEVHGSIIDWVKERVGF